MTDAPVADARSDAQIDAAPDTAIDAAVDAEIDAIPDAAAVGMISIHVAAIGVPQPNVSVYVQPDASAASVATLVTDANGDITTTITGGSYVSLVNPGWLADTGGWDGLYTHVLTYSGVQPGEHLDIDYGGPAPAAPTIAVTGVIPEPPSGANVRTLCGGGLSTFGPAVTVHPTRPCLVSSGPLVYIPVIGLTAQDLPTGAVFLPNAPYDGTPIDTSSLAVAPMISRHVTMSHDDGELWSLSAGLALAYYPSYDVITEYLSANSPIDLQVFGGIPASYQYAGLYATGGQGGHGAYDWGSTGSLDFDVDAMIGIPTLPVLAPATRSISWTSGPGATPDAVRVQAISTTSQVVWDIMGPPPASNRLVFPHLPAGVDQDLPDTIQTGMRAMTVTGGLPVLRTYMGHQVDFLTLFANPAGRYASAFSGNLYP